MKGRLCASGLHAPSRQHSRAGCTRVFHHRPCTPLPSPGPEQDPQHIARVLKDDAPGSSSGGDGTRVPRRSRPPVAPPRAGQPPPMPPLPPLPQQRFGSSSTGDGAAATRRSLDSLAGPPPGAAAGRPPAGSASVMVGGSGGAAAAAAAAGSRSMLLPPPTASTYSLLVDPRYLHQGSSYLSAALEQSMALQAGAGLVGPGSAAQQPRGARLHASATWGPADSGMQLVARARRTAPQAARLAAPLLQQQQQPGERADEGGGVGRGMDAAAARQPSPAATSPCLTAASPALRPAGPAAAGPAGGGGGPAAGPSSVRDAMSAALAAGMPSGAGADGRSLHVAPWYPRGVLVAHLAEHKK